MLPKEVEKEKEDTQAVQYEYSEYEVVPMPVVSEYPGKLLGIDILPTP